MQGYRKVRLFDRHVRRKRTPCRLAVGAQLGGGGGGPASGEEPVSRVSSDFAMSVMGQVVGGQFDILGSEKGTAAVVTSFVGSSSSITSDLRWVQLDTCIVRPMMAWWRCGSGCLMPRCQLLVTSKVEDKRSSKEWNGMGRGWRQAGFV